MPDPSPLAALEPSSAADDYLTRAEVGRRLRVSRQTVRQLALAGDLEEVMVAPRSPRITAASLRRHLERNRVTSPGAA